MISVCEPHVLYDVCVRAPALGRRCSWQLIQPWMPLGSQTVPPAALPAVQHQQPLLPSSPRLLMLPHIPRLSAAACCQAAVACNRSSSSNRHSCRVRLAAPLPGCWVAQWQRQLLHLRRPHHQRPARTRYEYNWRVCQQGFGVRKMSRVVGNQCSTCGKCALEHVKCGFTDTTGSTWRRLQRKGAARVLPSRHVALRNRPNTTLHRPRSITHSTALSCLDLSMPCIRSKCICVSHVACAHFTYTCVASLVAR